MLCPGIATAQTLSVVPDEVTAGSAGRTQQISVSALTGGAEPLADTWRVTVENPWLDVSPDRGGGSAGPSRFTLTVAPNAAFSARQGRVRVRSGAGRVVLVGVSQAAACRPDTISFAMPSEAEACRAVPISVTVSSGRTPTLGVAGPGRIDSGRIVFGGAGTVTIIARLPSESAFCAVRAEHPVAVTRCDQSISFDLPPVIAPEALPFPLVAEASSGLPVEIEVTEGPGRITDMALDFDVAGQTVLRASQGGNALYAAAVPLDRQTLLEFLPQEITIDLPANVIFASQTLPLSASALGDAPVTFSVEGPVEITPDGLRLTGPGLVTLTAEAAPTATHAAGTESVMLRVFSVDEAEALKRQGFVMNASARADPRSATLARIVAAYWAAGPGGPLPAEALASAWSEALPPEPTRLGLNEADLMVWMTSEMERRLRDAGAAGLAAAVSETAQSYEALYDQAFAERLNAYTRLGLRTFWRLETYTRTLSLTEVDITGDWIDRAFGTLYDVARETPELAEAIDLGFYEALFEVGVPTDPSMEQVVGGIGQVFEFAETPELHAVLTQVYATAPTALNAIPQILDRGRAGTPRAATGFSDDDSVAALLERLQTELTKAIDKVVEDIEAGFKTETDTEAEAKKKRAEALKSAEKTLKGISAVWDGAIKGLGLFVDLDADAQKALKLFGKLHFSMGSAYFNALKLIDSIAEHGLFSAASAALAGDFVKSISAIADLVSGKPSTDAQILKGLERISQQIAQLHDFVDLRFDRIDAKLNLALQALNEVLLALKDLDVGLGEVATTLAAVRVDIAAFELAVHRQFGELQRDAFEEQIGAAIDRRRQRLPLAEFRAAENQFFVHATANARGEALLPPSLCPQTAGTCGAPELTGPSVRYHYLRTLNEVPSRIAVAEGETPLPPLSAPELIVNPVEWTRAAGAYVTLAGQQDQHLGEIEPARVEAILGAGRLTVQALRRMTIWPGPEGNRARLVFDALLDDVAAAATEVREELAMIHVAAVRSPAMRLIVARKPWPRDTAEISALDHYLTEVEGLAAPSPRAWALARWSPYMTAGDLPMAENTALRRLAIAGFLQASGGDFFGADRSFAEASVSPLPPRPLSDVFDDASCAGNAHRRAVGVQWCLSALEIAVAGFNFMSEEFFCPEANMNVRRLFAGPARCAEWPARRDRGRGRERTGAFVPRSDGGAGGAGRAAVTAGPGPALFPAPRPGVATITGSALGPADWPGTS